MYGLVLLIISGCNALEGDTKKNQQQNDTKVELSKVSSIYFPDYESPNLKLLGFYVGMSNNEVNSILSDNSSLELNSDKFGNKNRDHINDISIIGSNKQILTLIWTNQNRQFLEKLIIFNKFSKHLQGEMKKLLTFESIDSNSEFTIKTLGYPVRIDTEETGDFSITTTYFYNNNIEVVHSNFSGDEWITLHISYPL